MKILQTQPTRATKGAFTLIELLVVIAIIAILAAILFPVFAQAREKARQTTCLSNEKQIVLAHCQYAQDYDETFTMAASWGSRATNFAWSLSPYLQRVKDLSMSGSTSGDQGTSVWQCPSDTTDRAKADGTRLSYGFPYNWWNTSTWPWYSDTPDGAVIAGRGLADFPDSSGTILLVELRTPKAILEFNNAYVLGPEADSLGQNCVAYKGDQTDEWSGCAKTISPQHAGGWNYGFVDGHVKWLKPTQTIGTGDLYIPHGMWTITEND